jgi:acyl carrier protein phosphodiesterase
MDDQIEIKKQFRQQQEKYTYYLIALCVAAVAFSITITRDVSLRYSQIPLGLAVLAWGLSIYFGLKFIQTIISALASNNSYLDVLKGSHPKVGDNPQKIEYASNILKEAMEEKSKTAGKFYDWQNRFFYIGFISFIAWHILEMYLKS